MNDLQDYCGLLGCLLFLVALPLTVLRRPRHSRRLIAVTVLLIAGLAVLPVGGLTLLAYIRAGLGDLSITGMIVLSLMIAAAYSGQQYVPAGSRVQLYNSVLAGAIILFPAGLGLAPFDTYAPGYGSVTMFAVLLGFAIYQLWRRRLFILALLLLAIAAYLLNILPSDNLWDYLLDPWLVMLALAAKTKDLLRRRALA